MLMLTMTLTMGTMLAAAPASDAGVHKADAGVASATKLVVLSGGPHGGELENVPFKAQPGDSILLSDGCKYRLTEATSHAKRRIFQLATFEGCK